MRVAVLSDIHAVLPALEAVLAEPDVERADRIVLTGDTVGGPQPVRTLDRLRDLGDRVVWVRGNGERIAVEHARAGTRPLDGMDVWSAAQLRADQVNFLDALPETVRFEVPELGPTLFCHATPRDDEEMVVVDSRPERWAEVNAGVDPAVTTIVCGHTHMPYVRLAHGRTIVNPGAVGMPYSGPGARWALLGQGVGIALRRTPFDLDAAVAEIVRECDYASDNDPFGLATAQAWADAYVRAKGTDVEALQAFGALDGR